MAWGARMLTGSQTEEELSPNGSQNASQEIPSAPPGRYQCPECSQTFGRVEHLTRHSRSHTSERFLKCSFCRKGFYRIDALRRHEQVHNQPKRSTLGKRARACFACAAARRKCSGGEPCPACEKRAIECKYPEVARTRRATASQAQTLDSTLPQNYENDEDNSMAHTQEDSPMSWSNESESPEMSSARAQDHLADGNSGINNSTQHSHNYNTDNFVDPFLHHDLQSQTPISPGLQRHDSHHQQSDQMLLHSDGQSDIATTHVSASIHDQMSSGHPQTLESSLSLNGDDRVPDAWFQNTFSSINWLPDNWTPDFQMDGGDGIPAFDQDSSMIFGQTLQREPASYPANSENMFLGTPISPRLSRPRDQARLVPHHLVDGNEMSSPSSQSTHSGRFYVDGDGARLPRVRKTPYRHSDAHAHAFMDGSRDANPEFAFPDLSNYQAPPNASLLSVDSIPPAVYSEILRLYNVTCVSSSHYSNFQGGVFPSLQVLNRCIQLFGSNFRSILPFIHPSSFDASSTHWLLTLALAAIGSHYFEEGSGQLVISMHEFLRRTIQAVTDAGVSSRPDTLTFTQIKLLSCVGMMYCGDTRLTAISRSYHSDLISFCGTEWTRQSSESQSSPGSNDSEQTSLDWMMWIRVESSRRTGYCIWLLDTMWAFHFQMRPLLSLDDAKVLIPCQEVLWEADSALDWQQLYACATPSPSLHAAIQLAYVEKRLQSSMGEFSRILCIHALFRRTWEVETYYSQPLALWTPTAEKGTIASASSSSVWLPSIQTYAKWRNSACDCLDILHWHANSVIGAASGMEHPTVLHLHLARVILLTPFRQIVQLAEIMTGSSTTPDEEMAIRTHISRWVLEDQHKARLAMIHAGVLFWHVRRYSTDAFYEPSSVYLSTLALWAYGTFAPHTTSPPAQPLSQNPTNADPPSPSSDTESLFPTSMQLDRPADDELVQLFVKRGASMKANITGVGNLCSSKGPVRVLSEGRKLLAGLKSWGYSSVAIRSLGGLVEVCRASQALGQMQGQGQDVGRMSEGVNTGS